MEKKSGYLSFESAKQEPMNPIEELRLVVAEAIDEADEAASARFFALGDLSSALSDKRHDARKNFLN